MLKYFFYIIAILFTLQSCTESEEETMTEETTSSTVTSETKVTLTLTTSDDQLKENYTVMMFDEVFEPNNTLPTAIKQVTSNSEGIALFELDDLIISSTEKNYYFEAFVESSNGYTLKSIHRTEIGLKKGTSTTTSIIVE